MCREKHKESRGWNSDNYRWGRGPAEKERKDARRKNQKEKHLPELREDCSQEDRARWRRLSSLAAGAAG